MREAVPGLGKLALSRGPADGPIPESPSKDQRKRTFVLRGCGHGSLRSGKDAPVIRRICA